MATYKAKQALNSYPGHIPHGQGEVRTVEGIFDVAVEGGGTALALNDVVWMCQLPANCVPLSCHTYNDEMDTGADAIVWDVGIVDDPEGSTEDADLFISGSTAGQSAGGADDEDAGGAWNTLAAVNNDRVIGITVTTGPGTGATTGKIYCRISYTSVQAP